MKVLLLSPFFSPNVGGVETHLNKLIACLNRQNHKVVVLTYQPLTTHVKAPKFEQREGLEIHRITWFGSGWFHKLEPYAALELVYLFPGLFFGTLFFLLKRKKEIDVIHAHGFVCSLITRLLMPIHKKWSVMSTHAIYHLEDRKAMRTFVKWMLNPFDKILAVGTPSKNELIAIGLPREKIEIHPNWVNTTYFQPYNRAMARKELNLPDDFLVLFLSRFIDKKGVSVLLEASKSTPVQVKYIFVGDGPMAETIKNTSKTRNNVIFIGRIPDGESDKIPKFYSAADLFVLPSQYEEGFAAAPLEALACGTPVLGTTKGCFPTDILDTSVGIMVEPTVDNVSREITRLFEHPEELSRLKNNCREYALKKFSEKNAEIIIQSYKNDKNN